MTTPPPYSQSDDVALARACAAGDAEAFRALGERYASLIEWTVVAVLDDRRPGRIEELPSAMREVEAYVRKDGAAAIRGFSGRSLGHLLAAITRQVAMAYVQDATPVANVASAMPTPAGTFLEDLVVEGAAREVAATLDRLSPHIVAIMRLRFRGLDLAQISATLGMQERSVSAAVAHLAIRLAELEGQPSGGAWRAVLGGLPVEEEVDIALQAEGDRAFADARSATDDVWRSVRERALVMPQARSTGCLDAAAVASLVDGSLRGAPRARAQGHLTTCSRCVDAVGLLVSDMASEPILRSTRGRDRRLAIGAACVTAGRYVPAQLLAESAAEAGVEGSVELLRLAVLGQNLQGLLLARSLPGSEPSGIVPSPTIPNDEEAPLVAAEALARGDVSTAYRAIDDHVAKSGLGARVRLLAAAAGHDVTEARALAESVLARRNVDPDLAEEARAILALPEGRSLPREILHGRLLKLVPDVLKHVLH